VRLCMFTELILTSCTHFFSYKNGQFKLETMWGRERERETLSGRELYVKTQNLLYGYTKSFTTYEMEKFKDMMSETIKALQSVASTHTFTSTSRRCQYLQYI